MCRLLAWYQLFTLACLVCLGVARALALYARGVRVVVVDRRRSPAEMARDLVLVVLLVVWGYETVAYAWPLRSHATPSGLGLVLFESWLLGALGCLVLAVGLLVYAWALQSFGEAWRLGIDRDRSGALVTSGAFGWTRNPIYVALDCYVVGTFLIQGRLVFLLLAVAIPALLDDQIRREERFLEATHGDAYRAYCKRVGRYLRWRGDPPGSS